MESTLRWAQNQFEIMFLDLKRTIRWIWRRRTSRRSFLGRRILVLLSAGLSYDWLRVVKLIIYEDIIHISSIELEFPCEVIWSINCYWERNGSVSTASIGLLFKNLLISSRQGHSFMKWSPPHNKQGYLAFLLPLLSFFGAIALGFSCWFPGFLRFYFPFFLLPVST